jgi:Tfp pilus assembly protein PilO
MTGYRARLILALVGTLLVCVAFYFFFVRNRQSELADVRDQVEAAENESVSLQAQLQELQGLKENAPKAEARLNEIRELIPQKDQVANFIFLVQDAANRAGVEFVTVTPEQPKAPVEDPSASVAQVRVTLGAKGDFFAIQDLVRRLYDLDRAVRIDNLAMDAPTSEEDMAEGITMTAAARIFFENPGGVPATPADGTTTTTPASTTTPTS